MKPSPSTWTTQFVLLTLLLQPTLAFAYIDPGAGGLLFQLLAPIFAACLAAWITMRKAISGFFRDLWRRLMGKTDR